MILIIINNTIYHISKGEILGIPFSENIHIKGCYMCNHKWKMTIQLMKFLNNFSNLKLSDILFIVLSKSSRLSVGSFTKFLKSSLFDIKFKILVEFSSTWVSKFDSLASSNKAREYLLAEVSENPLFLLNLLPQKCMWLIKNHVLINICPFSLQVTH